MKSGNDLLTMVPTKYLLAVFALFLVSVFYQGSVYPEDSFLSSGSGSNNNYSDRALDIVFDGNVYDSRKKEQRIPIEPGEFWLTESDNAVLPFDVYFTPPDESYGKLETLPSCNNDKHNATKGAKPTKIIFAHVVRTEAFRVHDFLASYASSCHAGFASAAICSGLSWESMIKGTWANRRVKGSKSVIKCPMKEARDRTGKKIKGEKYVQSTFLREHIDVLVGQVPLGSHEQWNDDEDKVVQVQYIVSLRNPYAWFISSVMDKLQTDNSEEGDSTPLRVEAIVETVNKVVKSELASKRYHEVYPRYLITPSQISWVQKEEADLNIDLRVELSLRNLLENNVLIVITEDMEDSMEKLQYLVDPKGDRKDLVLGEETQHEFDSSSNATITVENVLETLKEDESSSYQQLQEYLKYEMKIYEQAKDMHERQLAWVRKTRSIRLSL